MNDTAGVQWNYWVLMSPQAMAQLIKDMQSPPFRAAVDQAATDMSKDSELIIHQTLIICIMRMLS